MLFEVLADFHLRLNKLVFEKGFVVGSSAVALGDGEILRPPDLL